ncbi:uncharacterized protein [Parasteatoda tepidariorum]|uniref:uncharacterized protein n=1 Tax=Parasteatoda tepidariorum TaxID=114398 RepID=UPI001C71859F|nr:uncharacterized protein LOC107436837 isoform X1 [Parasteatoda tepidariorum]XP_042903334.1 uncharacterized protein LOC107436837 isoform X2 [Parasteatoda tepidariorum]
MRKVVEIILYFLLFHQVQGHGRLLEPPSRSSMWRFGYNSPPNYNDNELFCGGIYVQWSINAGKCGVCGDAYNLLQPRPNEAGGLYGKGIIVRNYMQGQVIKATIDLTANHLGYFEFRICPNNNAKKVVQQKCLDQYPLELADGSGTKYYVDGAEMGLIDIYLRLPQGLTCSQCVLQWQYIGANNWGFCSDGTQTLGCGPQETFRSCADVSIESTPRNRNLFLKSLYSKTF